MFVWSTRACPFVHWKSAGFVARRRWSNDRVNDVCVECEHLWVVVIAKAVWSLFCCLTGRVNMMPDLISVEREVVLEYPASHSHSDCPISRRAGPTEGNWKVIHTLRSRKSFCRSVVPVIFMRRLTPVMFDDVILYMRVLANKDRL